MRQITNMDDIIDSRDVIERIEELESSREDFIDDNPQEGESDEERTARIKSSAEEWDTSEEGEELAALKALAAECEGVSDWKHGAGLIRDSYFREYAEELADDIGAIDRNASWPLCYIDWEGAAEALKMDYTSVDFDGITYWVRS